MEQARTQSIDFLQKRGWTLAQAQGIVANLQHESSFNPGAIGDGGKAYGIAQWHPDRQAEFQTFTGKPIQGSSLEDQLSFVDYELRQGKEQSAGKRLMATTDAAGAARAISMFYERPADREGEAVKRAATAAKLAGVPFVAAPLSAATQATEVLPRARLSFNPNNEPDWPMLPTAKASRPGKTIENPVRDSILNTSGQILGAMNATGGDTWAAYQATIAHAQGEQAKRDATGFTDAFDAARHDPRIQVMFNLLDKVNRDDEVVPEGWTYESVRDKAEAGLNDDEREYLRENATGPQRLAEAQAQLAVRRDLDQTYGYAGGASAVLGTLAGGLMDPVGLAAGLGVGKLLQVGGVGSHALAQAGRVTAGRLSFVGENVLGNVAVEAMQDALGEVKGTGDYAVAASLGAVMAGPFLPFVHGKHIAGDVVGEVEGAVHDAGKSIQEQAHRQAQEGVAEQLRTGKEPVDAARAAEQAEVDAILGETQKGPVIREQAVPDSVSRSIREEYDGVRTGTEEPTTTPEPVVAEGAEPPPVIVEEPPVRTPEQKATYVQDAAKGEASVSLGTTKEGDMVKLEWVATERTAKPGDSTLRETIDSVLKAKDLPSDLKALFQYAQVAGRDALDEVKVRLFKQGSRPTKQGLYDSTTGVLEVAGELDAKQRARTTAAAILGEMNAAKLRVVAHEMMHSLTANRIYAYENGRLKGSAGNAVTQLNAVFERYKKQVSADADFEATYATTNLHEFVAQLWTEGEVQRILMDMPGSHKSESLWGMVTRAITKLLFGNEVKSGTALHDAMKYTDQLIQADLDIRNSDGAPVLFSQMSPNAQVLATNKRLQQMVRHAAAYMRANPIDPAKLNVLAQRIKKWGGLTDGLVLASSENPVAQMVASLVTETTTGAAGRRATVAVKVDMLRNQLVGNGLIDYNSSRAAWHKANKTSAYDRYISGDADRAFGKAVMQEINNRRNPAYTQGTDPNVVRAANSLEEGFQRAADMQRAAGTLGAERLDTSSRGYIPQALDGSKLAVIAEDAMRYRQLQVAFAGEFQRNLGWNAKDANMFAFRYLERQRRRAMGDHGFDGLSAATGDGMGVVRDTLQEMGADNSLRDRVAAMTASLGQGHTKRRLQIDMDTPFENGTLADFFISDPARLYRRYQHGTAGNIALAESNILGVQGVRELRQAASTVHPGVKPAKVEELEAMDRVFAEILGTPVAGEKISAGATNLGLLVNLQRLGGLVWTQAMEAMNMVHHLGVASVLNGAAAMPRMIGEVRASARGQQIANPILRSLEVYGGDVGMSGYKMVMPLDAPDMHVAQYMDQPSTLTRLLRGGAHVQAMATGFRALHAAQHRMVAEQITMRALRFIRDGNESKALADMGFTPQVVADIKADLQAAAKWDANGNLTAFDVSAISEPSAREAFVQSVHRGTKQIIQGTFIGEQNKWAHNDWLRLLTQLRTFGMTSMEKQWGRTRMNYGVAQAAAITFMQVAAALPIHMMRVHIAAAGRGDREEYLKNNLNPTQLVRASMNYASMSGLTSDVLELLTGVAGGWTSDQRTKELLGAQQQSSTVGRLIPVAGTIDSALKVASGRADVYTAIKQSPFSSVWYLVPAINLTKGRN